MQFLRTVADELVRSESKHTKSDRVVASRTLPHWEEHEEPEVTMIEEVEPINAAPAVSLAIDDFISDSYGCCRRPRRKKGAFVVDKNGCRNKQGAFNIKTP